MPQYGAQGTYSRCCSGALTGIEATGGSKNVAEGTASVYGAPAPQTEPPVTPGHQLW